MSAQPLRPPSAPPPTAYDSRRPRSRGSMFCGARPVRRGKLPVVRLGAQLVLRGARGEVTRRPGPLPMRCRVHQSRRALTRGARCGGTQRRAGGRDAQQAARTSSSRSPRPPCPSPALPAASRSIPPSSACSPPLAPALPASGSGAASAGAGTGTPALRADRERGARATACSPGLAAGRRRRSFSNGGTGSTRAFLAADLVNTRSAGAASARDSRACFLLPARSITVLRPCYSPAAEQSSLMAGHCIAWASAEHTLAGYGFSNRAGPIRLDGMI